MDPHLQFCPNFYCLHRGKTGQHNIRVHSRIERRFRCTTCGKTFAATKNTPYYRLHKPLDLVSLVLTLLCYGCPRQAIVAAYGLDERTVADWQQRAGQHGQRFHELHVQQGCVDVQHVQADEMWVKVVGRKLWMAMALAVPSRLWLGGVVSRRRDGPLIAAVVRMVRSCARSLAMLVCVDGLASYVTAFVKGFRQKQTRNGCAGRPRLLVEPGLLIGQVIKRYSGRRVVEVTRRVARGSAAAIAAVLARTGTGTGINTAYIERLNATFRARWTPLVRRGRALARREVGVSAGMWLVGCAYNFCWEHDSLRVAAPKGSGRRWQERTPAMAAGLTDHRWKLCEVLGERLPPPRWKAPRRKPRRRRHTTTTAAAPSLAA
jgi:transposase-like protein